MNLQIAEDSRLLQDKNNMNLWVIFLTGLTVGGLTCLAVQGGLLASVIAAREEETTKKVSNAKHTIYATTAFLVTKLAAYTILGFILGAFGGAININDKVQSIMQLIAGLYMLAVAGNLLNLHPIFRYVIIQPPKFLTRLARNQSKSKDLFAPGLLGAITIFIPCGTTIAMEALAISSANAISGASIMAAFVLGTIPMFFGIGAVTSVMGEAFKKNFFKLAAIIVIYLGITSVNGALVAFNSPVTLQSITDNSPITIDFSGSGSSQTSANDLTTNQNPKIDISSSGYSPTYLKVKQGLPVNLTLKSKDAFSCASTFRIPSMGISKNLNPNDTQLITFTPTQPGKIQFNCSMGMYRGIIEVI